MNSAATFAARALRAYLIPLVELAVPLVRCIRLRAEPSWQRVVCTLVVCVILLGGMVLLPYIWSWIGPASLPESLALPASENMNVLVLIGVPVMLALYLIMMAVGLALISVHITITEKERSESFARSVLTRH